MDALPIDRPLPVELVTVDDGAAAAGAAADVLVALARRGGAIALAGGSTPRAAYALAAATEPDWSAVDVWLGDDRCVPHDDERSNARLVREALLDRLEVPPSSVHLVPEGLEPAAAAAAYDAALAGTRLAMCLLGLGPDAHTASLFPGMPSLEVRDRRAVSSEAGLAPWVPRVTMTIPMLASADHVVFLAVGPDKADAARRAFAAPPSPEAPASLVRSAQGRTTAILDRAAAGALG